MAFDHRHTLDEAVDVVERRLQRLLRLLDPAGNRGRHVAHFARGRRNPAITGHRLGRGVAQRAAHLGLALHACRHLFDVARHVADLNAQFARLRGNVADDRRRPARPAKAKARHECLLDGAVWRGHPGRMPRLLAVLTASWRAT